MLRSDVVQAVSDGKFHVYAVESVDQALELLTGVPAGEVDAAGNWPENSVNGRVAKRLRHFAALRVAIVSREKGRTRGRRKGMQ